MSAYGKGLSADFYSRPCGRGDVMVAQPVKPSTSISTHAPAGGATYRLETEFLSHQISTHAPAGGATLECGFLGGRIVVDFYSRPCGRGDLRSPSPLRSWAYFYSRPCGRGDVSSSVCLRLLLYFYSRPCGRGDGSLVETVQGDTKFLLTPLREGRRSVSATLDGKTSISTHAPAGGAT